MHCSPDRRRYRRSVARGGPRRSDRLRERAGLARAGRRKRSTRRGTDSSRDGGMLQARQRVDRHRVAAAAHAHVFVARKSRVASPVRAWVVSSMTMLASRSLVRFWSRAARLVVLPITPQIRRSTAWMLPTYARPVAMPTPTARRGTRRVPGSQAVDGLDDRRARPRRRHAPCIGISRGAPNTAIRPSPWNSTTAPRVPARARDRGGVGVRRCGRSPRGAVPRSRVAAHVHEQARSPRARRGPV